MQYTEEINRYLKNKRAIWTPVTFTNERARLSMLHKYDAFSRPLSELLIDLQKAYKPYTVQQLFVRLRCIDNEALGGNLKVSEFMAQSASVFRGNYLGRLENITQGAVDTILNYALVKTPRAFNALYLMALAGLRKSEALSLTWSSISKVQGELMVRQGKGRKDRKVSFPRILQDRLLASGSDKLVELPSLEGSVRAIRKATGIYFTPHMLRAYAIQRYSEVLSNKELQGFAGHSDINTTMKYIVIDQQEVGRKIEGLFRRDL